MPGVSPVEMGELMGLVGARLRADVELEPGRTLDWFEIELAPRSTPDAAAWDRPLWRFRSDMPDFDRLGGKPAFDGMDVRGNRPRLRFSVPAEITAYRWELRQDNKVVGRGRVREGIGSADRQFEIVPEKRLRRTNQPAAPRLDVLYPPFETHFPATATPSPETRVRYSARTGSNHNDDHNRFSVDFNFRSEDADRGHWVVAVAKGTVDQIIENNGEVHIVHEDFGGGGRFETWYAHMQPVKVNVGDRVDPLQRIGRIGSKYHTPGVTISPHLHHQHRLNGKGEKMQLFMRSAMRNVEVSRSAPTATEIWAERVSAWNRPRGLARARFLVRVKRASDGQWSQANRLRFTVAARDDEVEPTPDAPDQPAVGPTDIAHRYGGRAQEPGDYSLRYRVRDDAGVVSDWAFDHTLVVEPVFND